MVDEIAHVGVLANFRPRLLQNKIHKFIIRALAATQHIIYSSPLSLFTILCTLLHLLGAKRAKHGRSGVGSGGSRRALPMPPMISPTPFTLRSIAVHEAPQPNLSCRLAQGAPAFWCVARGSGRLEAMLPPPLLSETARPSFPSAGRHSTHIDNL
jgi:hypothetical protein